jgi:hypothetical protein
MMTMTMMIRTTTVKTTVKTTTTRMMTMTDELVKRWDDYVESMGSVMGDVEHMAQQMRDRIEALTAERDRLLSTVNALESLRPHWAQGYSSDSMAAQASTEAMVGMWKILGVNDQTSAVVTLKALTAERDQAWKMVAEADTRLGQALGEAIQDKADNARLREALNETAQILSQCTFETIRVRGQYIDRREAVSRALAALNTGKEVMPFVPIDPANQSDIGPGDQEAVAGAALEEIGLLQARVEDQAREIADLTRQLQGQPRRAQDALTADTVQAQIDAAVTAERERCAKVAFGFGAVDMLAEHKPFAIAAAIRKGDQP